VGARDYTPAKEKSKIMRRALPAVVVALWIIARALVAA
jgi:hypothetical protein